MDVPLIALEMTGTIDEQHQLQLDAALPIAGPKRVRVIVLYAATDELDEATWLHAASRNAAFADLHNAEEDIYSLADGEAFHDERGSGAGPVPIR